MTSKLKLALVVWCLGALTAPVAVAQTAPAASAPAQTQEFVAESPNVPQLGKPSVRPLSTVACGGFLQPPCPVPEPGSLPLFAVAALAAFAVMRRKK